MGSVKDLADEAYKFFQTKTRDNHEQFWSTKDETPEWVSDMCQSAHARMFPDDWKYQFIVDALSALSDFDDVDEARDSLEPEIYTMKLCAWMCSNIERIGYVDEWRDVAGASDSIEGDMQGGQLREMQEVFDLVVEALQEREEAIEDNEQEKADAS